jgi:uncharacterized membrane protein
MDAILDQEFTSLVFMYGGIFLVGGILFKLFPPKRMTWYNSTETEYTPQNEAIWRERIKFITTPMILTGLLSIALSFLPLVFDKATIFTFESANILCFALFYLTTLAEKRHLKKVFGDGENTVNNS